MTEPLNEDESQAKAPLFFASSRKETWRTPRGFLYLAERVLGTIDLLRGNSV